MFVPTDNNVLVKDYNKISKYKDRVIENEKNLAPQNNHRACNRVIPVYDEEKGQIRTLATYLTVIAYMKYKIMHFSELLIILGEYDQSDCKMHPPHKSN